MKNTRLFLCLCLASRFAVAEPPKADLDLLKRAQAGTQDEKLPTRDDVDLWTKVEKAMTSIKAMRYDLVKHERLWPTKEMEPEETFQVKFRKPYDILMNVTGGPNKGRRYLYRQGWPYMKVHVFGKLLQWMVPNIPPISKLALEHDHHAITDASYEVTCQLVRDSLTRNIKMREQDPTAPAIQIDPVREEEDDGVPSYYYRSVNPDLFRTYKVTPFDGTVFDIGKKVGVHPYLLMYYNPDKVPAFDRLKVGDELRYPLYYGRVTEFWIDRKTLLLHHIRITDFNGKTYEEYKYRNIRTDDAASLSDVDFDPANPEYEGF